MDKMIQHPIRTGRVGLAELTALLTIYTTTDVFLSYPARVAQEGAQAGWMIPLISGLLILVAFLVVHWCMQRFPGENILEVATRLLTPFVSIPVTLLYTFLFLTQTALVMREFTETVVTTVLPKTPAVVVAGLFLIVILYYAYKGLEGLTRVAIFLAMILALGLFLLLALPMTWFNGTLLLPVMGRGVGATLLHGATNTSMFLNVLMLAVLYPAVRNQRHFLAAGIVSIVLTAVIISAVVIVFLGTFAVAVRGAVPFPMYQLARLIYIGRFVQRLESLFVFLWTAAAIIKMGMGLWMSAYLYASVFRMPVYRPLLFPLAVILFIVSFLPPDFPMVQDLSAKIFEPYGWTIAVALPVLVVLLSVMVDVLKMNAENRRVAT